VRVAADWLESGQNARACTSLVPLGRHAVRVTKPLGHVTSFMTDVDFTRYELCVWVSIT